MAYPDYGTPGNPNLDPDHTSEEIARCTETLRASAVTILEQAAEIARLRTALAEASDAADQFAMSAGMQAQEADRLRAKVAWIDPPPELGLRAEVRRDVLHRQPMWWLWVIDQSGREYQVTARFSFEATAEQAATHIAAQLHRLGWARHGWEENTPIDLPLRRPCDG